MAEKRASRCCTRDEAPWKSRSGKCSQTIPTSWAEILGFSGVAIPGVPEPVCYSKRGGHGSRNFAEPNLNAEVSGLCRPANDSIAGCGLSQGTMRSGTPLRGTRRPEQVICTRRGDTAETNLPPTFICVSPRAAWVPKWFDTLLESCMVCPIIALRRVKHSYRCVKVYEVRNLAPYHRDHRNRRPVAAISDGV